MEVDWIKPDYKVVDLVEYEMKLERRRCIEDFCTMFFKKYWENDSKILIHACRSIIKEKRLVAITDVLSRELTIENFNDSFQSMCMELFKNNEVRDEYVVSLLAFCIELDSTLQDCAWYSLSLLITALVDALEEADFLPVSFNWNQKDLLSSVTASFIVIIPSLLLLYTLFK